MRRGDQCPGVSQPLQERSHRLYLKKKKTWQNQNGAANNRPWPFLCTDQTEVLWNNCQEVFMWIDWQGGESARKARWKWCVGVYAALYGMYRRFFRQRLPEILFWSLRRSSSESAGVREGLGGGSVKSIETFRRTWCRAIRVDSTWLTRLRGGRRRGFAEGLDVLGWGRISRSHLTCYFVAVWNPFSFERLKVANRHRVKQIDVLEVFLSMRWWCFFYRERAALKLACSATSASSNLWLISA